MIEQKISKIYSRLLKQKPMTAWRAHQKSIGKKTVSDSLQKGAKANSAQER
jgi:hypothetical protein